jgi:DnaK suppressor protein
MSNHSAVRLELVRRLEHLMTRAGKMELDLRSPRNSDWTERATETENDEVLQSLDEVTRKEVRQIGEALKRIDNGKYGVCESCGKPIGDARLAALPTVTTCARCAPQ